MARETSFDILRNYSTLMVAYYHIVLESNQLYQLHLPLFANLLCMLSRNCNYLFMLISSYMASKSDYKLSKAIPICIQTLTASSCLYFLKVSYYRQISFSLNGLLNALTPLTHDIFWYPLPFLINQLYLG